MKIIVAYGSLGKIFHMKEFSDELEKLNVTVKLVHDSDYSRGFPSKRVFRNIRNRKVKNKRKIFV